MPPDSHRANPYQRIHEGRSSALSHSGGATLDLQLLIDSTPGLIHTSQPDGYLDFFNQSWLKYVGRSLEDVQGWKWTAAIHPDDVEGIVEAWRASLATGEPFLHEARVRRADGQYRWMLHHKVALRDEHGKIVKWYGSSLDIEDRKRAEEELRAAMSERARLAAVRADIGVALARKDNLKVILDLCAKALVRNLDAAFARIWTLGRTCATWRAMSCFFPAGTFSGCWPRAGSLSNP